MGCVFRNVRDSDTSNFWYGFLQEFQTFVTELNEQIGHSGDIPAWLGEAFDEACRHRIRALARHNNWNGLSRIDRRLDDRSSSSRNDDIDVQSNELRGKQRKSIKLLLRIAKIIDDVFAFSVAKLTQGKLDALRTFCIARLPSSGEITDMKYFRSQLRVNRTAQQK